MNRAHFTRHLSLSSFRGSRKCSCGRKFGTSRETAAHFFFDHQSPDRVDCSACGEVFGSSGAHQRHKCPAMPEKYVFISPPLDRVLSKREGPTLRCQEADCGLLYGTALDLSDHVLIEHGRRITRDERIPITPLDKAPSRR